MVAERFILAGGTLFDGVSDETVADAAVWVDRGEIVYAGPHKSDGFEGAEVVDCGGRTIVPGLINAHLHLSLDGDDTPYPVKLPYLKSLPDSELVMIYLRNAVQNLRAGVTTVRDMHPGPGGTVEGMKIAQRLLDRPEIPGSRCALALRPLVMKGGHGGQWLSRAASGPDDVQLAVREVIAEGAEVVKLMTAHSWGPLPGKPESLRKYFTLPELRAAVETAHRANIKVSAHSHGVDSIADNLEAGIDSIEHGSGLTEDLVQRMLDQGTYLVPTISSYANFVEEGRRHGEAEQRVADAAYVVERHRAGLKLAIEAKLKIAAGTDSGFQYLGHGAALKQELEIYVELGMRPVDALRSATSVAAELLGREDRIGRVAAGFDADLLITEGDPLTDISRLREVAYVMAQGRLYSARDLDRIGGA